MLNYISDMDDAVKKGKLEGKLETARAIHLQTKLHISDRTIACGKFARSAEAA